MLQNRLFNLTPKCSFSEGPAGIVTLCWIIQTTYKKNCRSFLF